jgi:hypothetical protein
MRGANRRCVDAGEHLTVARMHHVAGLIPGTYRNAVRFATERPRFGVPRRADPPPIPRCSRQPRPRGGAEPEGADSTIRAMNALRSFAATTRLVLAHVS